MFETKTRDLGGRIGKLKTLHGYIETPFLFPVVDPAKQVPDLSSISNMGFNGIITNAYLFYKRCKGIPKSIHNELSWSKTIMTDSGGYQILVYGDIEIDNKTIIEYEKSIKSDIAVILDIPTGSKMNFEEAERAVEETYKRGIETLPIIMDSEQLWVYPIQGAPYKDLFIRSLVKAYKLPYDIYAVGSPTVILEKYKYSKLVELVILARMILPQSKPLHVFGVGHPMIIPFIVAVGGDLFDSASYILYARDGRYMVEHGTKKLRELTYFPCSCPVCSRFNPRDLLELPEKERVRLLATHNLFILKREIDSVKQAIKENRLWELLEYKARSHPSLFEVFNLIKKYVKILEKTTPWSNPSGRSLLIFDQESCYNPKLLLNKERAMRYSLKKAHGKITVLIPAYKKPYSNQEEYRKVINIVGTKAEILFIHPFLGIFIPHLSFTYPFYQHESRIFSVGIKPRLIAKSIKKLIDQGVEKIIIIDSAWFDRGLYYKILETLPGYVDKIAIYKLDEISSQTPRELAQS
ncbi:MAG: tRNA guanosine(15) transglycosylase TgtA [Desulfurococcaceae archaeon]